MQNVAVIGAGMAGCTLARRLLDAGCAVHVFDKGRAAGGRMATRAEGPLRFDHGAQFMSARSAQLQARMDEWRRAGAVARWPEAECDERMRWVGVPGMNALAPRMLWGAELMLQTTVGAIGSDRLGWWLSAESGRSPVCFDAVLVTVPAPQAHVLFDRCSGADAASFATAMRRIRYAPCWTLMAAFSDRLDAPDCMRFPPGGALHWAARNSAKPQRDGSVDCWVVHAGADWSERHVELSAEDVKARLCSALADALGTRATPLFAKSHRWRYARVVQALGEPCLWDAGIRLGYASDGCLGERIEDAFASANALADRLLGGPA